MPSPAEGAPSLVAYLVPRDGAKGELTLTIRSEEKSWRGYVAALERAGLTVDDVARLVVLPSGGAVAAPSVNVTERVRAMEIGDSFFLPSDHPARTQSTWASVAIRLGRQLTTRKVPGGAVVTRVS